MKCLKKISTHLLVILFIAFINCNSQKSTMVAKEMKTKLSTTSAIISIEGMACQAGCADTIKENILQLEGVEKAMVSYENANAIINYNPNQIAIETITKTITDTKVKNYTYTVKNIETKKK